MLTAGTLRCAPHSAKSMNYGRCVESVRSAVILVQSCACNSSLRRRRDFSCGHPLFLGQSFLENESIVASMLTAAIIYALVRV